MKKIDIIQNTDDWGKLRDNHLGASDANIIMNESKSITPKMLYEDKLGIKKIDTKGLDFIFAKGHRYEEKMRPIMEMLYDTELEPIVVVSEDKQYDFLMCSLDGYSEGIGCTWENKFVGQDDYGKVAEGEMLMHYYPQVQHQLMLTNSPFCIFSVIADNKESKNPDFPYKYAYIEVCQDVDYIKNQLLPKLSEFWDMLKNKVSPEVSDLDVIDLSENSELTELLAEYNEGKTLLDGAKDAVSDLEKRIYKIVGKAKKATCNGVKITKSKSKDKEVADPDSYFKEKKIDLIELGFKKVQKGRITKRITFPKA